MNEVETSHQVAEEGTTPDDPALRDSSENASTDPALSAWDIWVPIGLFALVIVSFLPALDSGFVYWDDNVLVLDNAAHRGLTLESFIWMLSTSETGHFQPLTWLTYAIDDAIWNRYDFGYHLTNVLWHGLTAIAFYFVTRELLLVCSRGKKITSSAHLAFASALAALVFALHPLRAESVAWLAERRDVVGGFFYLLSVWFYLNYVRGMLATRATGTSLSQVMSEGARYSGRPVVYYWLAVATCACSLLAKASAITMVLVLLVLDVFPLRRVGASGLLKPTAPASSRVLKDKIPFLALGVLAGLRALVAQREAGALAGWSEHGLMERVAQACYGLLFYLGKTLWPANLGPLYEIPPKDELLGSMFWLSALGVVLLVAGLFAMRRKWPGVLAALAVYAIVLLPVLGVAQSGQQLVADRYSYLSCLGWAVLAGWLMLALLGGRWFADASGRTRGMVAALSGTVIVVALQNASFAQQGIWKSDLTLWERGVKVCPESSIAWVNYGDAMARGDQLGGAAERYLHALALNDLDVVAWHHLAEVQLRAGRTEEAGFSFVRALEIDPDRRGAHLPLARLYAVKGKHERALQVLKDGVRATPDEWEILSYLAELLSTLPFAELRNGEEATGLMFRAMDVRGGFDANMFLTLATAQAEAGQFAEAVGNAEEALKMAEDDGTPALVEKIEERLNLFKSDKPYHIAMDSSSPADGGKPPDG